MLKAQLLVCLNTHRHQHICSLRQFMNHVPSVCSLCRYWSQGFCRDGDRCRFAHNALPAADGANHGAAFAVAPGSMAAPSSTPAPHFGLHLGSHDAKLSGDDCL